MTSKVYVQATAIGWLKEDAVIKEVGNGFSVCKFCVKVQKYNRQTKEKEMIFLDCDLWGKKAEKLRPMLRAGKYVQVFGTIESFKFVTINVQDVTLLSQTEVSKKREASPSDMKESSPDSSMPEPTQKEMEDLF